MGAHRYSYIATYGDIPKGMVIMHLCDNRSCVNPKHLKPGTHQENSQDMVSKNRHVDWSGENHGNHKLTTEDVLYIKTNWIKGNRWHPGNTIDLADKFGVSDETIRKIANNKRWKHIQNSGLRRKNNANTIR